MSSTIDASTARRTGFAVVAASALLAAPPSVAAAEWAVPVGGSVTRGFDLGPDPFERGRHRGADFAARPGATVRASCGGRVVVAGRVGTSGRVVTIRCGPWRVSHLPLAGVSLRAGAVVARGARIGSAATSRQHDGLHLGVRRDGDRFGYADPLRFLTRDRLLPPPGAIPPRGTHPAPPEAGPRTVEARAGRPVPEPHPIRLPSVTVHPRVVGAGSSPAGAGGLAPWPAWAGLALLLAGAIGAGVGRWPRRRRTALSRASAQEVR